MNQDKNFFGSDPAQQTNRLPPESENEQSHSKLQIKNDKNGKSKPTPRVESGKKTEKGSSCGELTQRDKEFNTEDQVLDKSKIMRNSEDLDKSKV